MATSKTKTHQEIFSYLEKELDVGAGLTQLKDIENIVLKSEAVELAKIEAIQEYLLEHGANDEKINDEILILKGLKKPNDEQKSD